MSIVETLNQAAFLHLNADLTTVAWKLNIAAATADYLIYLIPLILVALWCWGNESQRTLALKACVVALVALGINQLFSILWPHPRPLMMGLGHTFIPHAIDSSFPSDHATVFAAIGLTLVLANIRSVVGWSILLLGVCVAWARIFLGVHFPLDMVGAIAVVGAVWVVISPLWGLLGERHRRRDSTVACCAVQFRWGGFAANETPAVLSTHFAAPTCSITSSISSAASASGATSSFSSARCWNQPLFLALSSLARVWCW